MKQINFLVLFLFFNQITFGMESEQIIVKKESKPNHKPNVLSKISAIDPVLIEQYKFRNIKKSDIKPEKTQWWYLDQMIEHKGFVQTICFNMQNTNLITTSCDKYNENYIATSFNLTSKQIVAEFPCNESSGKSICYNPSKTLKATRTPGYGQIVFITDNHIFLLTHPDTIASFSHPAIIHDICFDNTGELLATAAGNTARIFKQHKDYTLEQLQLKQAMNTWLALKKPVLTIEKEGKIVRKDILSALLKEIINKKIFIPHFEQLNIENELLQIWETFPANMQHSILRTMEHKIKKYGRIKQLQPKPSSHSCENEKTNTTQPVSESLTQEKYAAYQSYANLLNTYNHNWNLGSVKLYISEKK